MLFSFAPIGRQVDRDLRRSCDASVGRVADGRAFSNQFLEEMRTAYVGMIVEEVYWKWLSSST